MLRPSLLYLVEYATGGMTREELAVWLIRLDEAMTSVQQVLAARALTSRRTMSGLPRSRRFAHEVPLDESPSGSRRVGSIRRRRLYLWT